MYIEAIVLKIYNLYQEHLKSVHNLSINSNFTSQY